MKRIIGKTLQSEWVLLGFTYVVGLLLSILFFLARLLPGVVDVRFPERRPRWEKGMIIAANHQRFWAAFVAPLLFFSEWVFRPRRWGPFTTPDTKNSKKLEFWYFKLAMGRAVFIPRGNARGIQRAFVRIIEVLRTGGRIIFFPEGGRTASSPDQIVTPKGKRMRPLKEGVGTLSLKSGASILPLWVEWNGWRSFFRVAPLVIKFGHLLKFPDEMPANERTAELEKALLALADE